MERTRKIVRSRIFPASEMERHGLIRFFHEEGRASKKNAIELDPESFTDRFDNRISGEKGGKPARGC